MIIYILDSSTSTLDRRKHPLLNYLVSNAINGVVSINTNTVRLPNYNYPTNLRRAIKGLQSKGKIRIDKLDLGLHSSTKEYQRAWHLNRKFGLSSEDYQNKLNTQERKCIICGDEESKGTYGRFVVDHCHSTGKVRGLLCHPCNIALGNFKDDVTIMQNAINYIKQHKHE